VTEDVDRVRQVDEPRLVGGPSDVQRLERREDLDVALDQVGEPEQQQSTLGAGELRPAASVELRQRRGDRVVDVLLGRRRDGREMFLARGGDHVERGAVGGFAPGSADEQARRNNGYLDSTHRKRAHRASRLVFSTTYI
jgi:hypothetical protein